MRTFRPGAHTLRTDDSRARKYLLPTFGDREPRDLITLDVDRLRLKLAKAGKSPQTVKHVLALLRRIIRFGAAKGLAEAPDPHKLHIAIPRVDNETTEDLNPEELARLLKALSEETNVQIKGLMLLALYTGMRRGGTAQARMARPGLRARVHHAAGSQGPGGRSNWH